MKNAREYKEAAAGLLANAKDDLASDMRERGIGAIIWDNSTAGFHFIPEVVCRCKDGNACVARVSGLYLYDGVLYLIKEEKHSINIDKFYDRDTEVKPSVVTLSESIARQELGNPVGKDEYTVDGSLEEWLAVADCYFEALNEK